MLEHNEEEYVPNPEDTIDFWRNKATAYSMENGFLREKIEDLTTNLEVANERWLKAINESVSFEVTLRKLNKKEIK